ncbi:hypothetical protein DFH09DRAFT_896607 [Mycena vulgaris]|nr:hypothetical protein DFH09DRAFT_896607 [Mycena vulgaris]
MQRSNELWLSDGDLIIQTDNLSFRIHSRVLATSSTVFADMLLFPPPVGSTADNETVDGLPTVRLFDSDADATLFLKGIFDPTFLGPLPSPNELPVVLDILRLANKYDAQELFRRALFHLGTLYPTSLPKFLNVPGHLHTEYPDGKLEGHLLVLAAALNFDARWLLPCLYYEISCYPLRDILTVGAAWDALSPSTQRLIVTTHARRLDRVCAVNKFKFVENYKCDWPKGCPFNSMHAAGKLVEIIARDGTMDPLRYWTEEKKTKYRNSRCIPCLDGLEKQIRQTEIWAGLPSVVGFTGWREVRKMKRVQTALGT